MTDQTPLPEQPIRVLLVEDALDQALLLKAMLGTDRYEVTHAQDGGHGLTLFESKEFDVVITDLNLPGMDGFDLTRALKDLAPEVPIIAATGYSSPGYTDAAFRAGVDALLTKPFDRSELLGRLRELLPTLHSPVQSPPSVFALGARPGDVVLGCGATLAFHRSQGHDVLVFILSSGEPGSGLDLAAARKAAERLGARVILAGASDSGDDLMERQHLLERVVRELSPAVAYIPSLADSDPYRKEAHHLGRAALAGARALLAYGTATATLDFRPTFFKTVDSHISRKLEALEAFQVGGSLPRELSARFALAAARYWGRFADFGEVEPFEVIGKEGKS
ncbi:MAG: response regulator [Gemmatimonadales bacterium]|nr:MAG: response regulator [Gemmatimonadales bacterium]